MNSVSWFIYVAQVSDSLGSLFVFIGVVIGLCTLASYGVPRIANFGDGHGPNDSDYWAEKPLRAWFCALAVICLVIGNLMPEKNTMYAIAASQVGEQIVKSDIANDATKALQQWIKKQIDPEPKK